MHRMNAIPFSFGRISYMYLTDLFLKSQCSKCAMRGEAESKHLSGKSLHVSPREKDAFYCLKELSEAPDELSLPVTVLFKENSV